MSSTKFVARHGINSLGDLIVTGSITATGGISISGSITSASFAVSASQAQNAVSSSYAVTASYISGSGGGVGFPFSGSAVITGSLLITNLTGSGVKYVVADNDGLMTAQTPEAAILSTQTVTASAGQTVFNITNGYTTGLVNVFVNGTKLNGSEYTDTNGTSIVFATGSMDGDVVEFEKYFPASGVTNNALRSVNYFTAASSQSVFSASYTPGLLDVFYNGSKLSNTDYTANNGTSITLATASNAGDLIEIDVYSYQVGSFSGIGGEGTSNQISYFNTSNSITGSPNFTISGSTMTVTGSLLVSGSNTLVGNQSVDGVVILSQVAQTLNFADDDAAAAGGVPIGGLYRSGNFILIRVGGTAPSPSPSPSPTPSPTQTPSVTPTPSISQVVAVSPTPSISITPSITITPSPGVLPIVSSGLVLNLNAGDASSYSGTGTTWTDLSGNNNNGTLVNSPTYSTTNGGYLTTNGTNNYITIPDSSTLRSNTTTVSIWFKYTTVTADGGSGYGSLFSKADPAGTFNGWNIYIYNNVINAQIKNGSSATDLSGTSINTTSWYNATLVAVSGGTSYLYLNNSLLASVSTLSYTVTTQPVRISRAIDSFWSYFGGNIGQVLQYNRALNSTELTQNYNATKTRFGL